MHLLNGITHIIFDLDGLLIDTEPTWAESENEVLNELGTQWDEAIGKQHTGMRLDEVAAIMVKAYGLSMSEQELHDRILNLMFAHLRQHIHVLAGAERAIQMCHEQGLILAIASSSAESYIRFVVEQLNWSPYIQVIASAYDVAKGKPAPDVYLRAAELLGAEPSQCLALEDSVNGTRAAHAAGMRAIAIPGHGFTPVDYTGLATAVFPSLDDFLAEAFTNS